MSLCCPICEGGPEFCRTIGCRVPETVHVFHGQPRSGKSLINTDITRQQIIESQAIVKETKTLSFIDLEGRNHVNG